MASNEYDAIVIGSGISGRWAAKELTEKGLKVLMLERGQNIEHIKDYKNCISEIAKKLSKENYNIAVDIASTPDQIRGFGHVKEKNIKIAEDCQSNLITAFNESK